MIRFEVTPEAWRDIEDIRFYIAHESPSTADRFLENCCETFEWLTRAPRVGRAWRGRNARTRGVRVWRVTGFPNHLVFYSVSKRAVTILHVLPGARDLDRHLDPE